MKWLEIENQFCFTAVNEHSPLAVRNVDISRLTPPVIQECSKGMVNGQWVSTTLGRTWNNSLWLAYRGWMTLKNIFFFITHSWPGIHRHVVQMILDFTSGADRTFHVGLRPGRAQGLMFSCFGVLLATDLSQWLGHTRQWHQPVGVSSESSKTRPPNPHGHESTHWQWPIGNLTLNP